MCGFTRQMKAAAKVEEGGEDYDDEDEEEDEEEGEDYEDHMEGDEDDENMVDSPSRNSGQDKYRQTSHQFRLRQKKLRQQLDEIVEKSNRSGSFVAASTCSL